MVGSYGTGAEADRLRPSTRRAARTGTVVMGAVGGRCGECGSGVGKCTGSGTRNGLRVTAIGTDGSAASRSSSASFGRLSVASASVSASASSASDRTGDGGGSCTEHAVVMACDRIMLLYRAWHSRT
ncbi:hypothetical protein AMAG_20238 [Allomyces macrogynus ATCC 38327]|uniref:Uncharacterized protein n=1 Tax=Allomyces macrogynus (strain ATCC 38327) TaxID=578462 RepID=A0A0L0T5S8_ALLM3|nr:hypothetical protein AMAG_20238 [Allomyces macrogynus ATCC 38327]|eukprot:KNE70102.1 hypothetical protein AMAG_20238 [Allomyces macrogynus ATCC 38327]